MNKGKTSISMLGRWLTIILFLSSASASFSQSWWSEGFGSAAVCNEIDSLRDFNAGTWSITYPTAGITDSIGSYWFVSARESVPGLGTCGDGCQTSPSLLERTLHISTNAAGIVDQGAIYENDSTNDIIAWSPPINTVGANNLLLSFHYIEGGNASDNGTIVIGVGGTGAPVTIYDPAKTVGTCSPDGVWTKDSVYIDAIYNNLADIRIGFRWESNGDGVGGFPSFALDSLVIEDVVPYADFGMSEDTICAGEDVSFVSTSLGDNNSYFWQFGATATPTTSTNANPALVNFPTAGTYVITLTATNPNGSDTHLDTLEVLDCQPPTPAYSASQYSICVGQCIDFTDESIPGTFGTGEWQWAFQGGSPNTSTAQNPTNICYTAPGKYYVQLTVTDTASEEFATTIFEDSITVGDCYVPSVTFVSDTDTICNNDYITYFAQALGSPTTITWIFEGGSPAMITGAYEEYDTIEVLYPTAGLYDVTVIVENPAGTGSDTVENYAHIDDCQVPIAKIEANRRIICPKEEVVFIDNSVDAREWYWEFAGGQPSSSNDQFPPPITYQTPGKYPVVLIVKNVNGVDTLIAEAFITVDSCNVPVPRFELEKDSICRSTCLQLFNKSKYLDITDTTDSFAWVLWWHPFKDSITGTSADTISAATPGYEWMATDTALLSLTDTSYFVVHRDFFPAMAPIWNHEDPILCFDDSGSIGIQMFAYNQHGVGVLNDQDIAVISVGGAYPELKPGPDKVVRTDNIESRFYLDDTVSFETRGTGPYFRWFPEEGLSCYDCPRPIIYPTETRKYFVTNYDDYGCQAYDSVTVYVEEAYYAGIPNIFSPNGDDNNDILWVRGNGISSDGFVMRLWDRYGKVVFESYSQNDGWNGNYKGAPAPTGSYKYYVKLVFDDGRVEELTGNVTLVRY